MPSTLKAAPDFWARITGGLFAKKDSRPVILVSEFDNASVVFSHAALLPGLARSLGADLKAFSFVEGNDERIATTYREMGLPRALGMRQSRAWQSRAKAWAAEMLKKIKSRTELLGYRIDGFPIGMVIYDNYLRVQGVVTVDLADPLLLDSAIEAAANYFATIEYFDTHEVAAVVPDHMVYNRSGILAQVAWSRNIPVLVYGFADGFGLYRLKPMRGEEPRLEVPYMRHFDRYPEEFAGLGDKERRLEKGRAALEDHLSGGRKDLIFGGHSAYAAASSSAPVRSSGKHRMLVMLHDFCDAPHVYGKFLFTDFTDWVPYLLDRASDTSFEWIVKPHPNLQDRSRELINKTNSAALRSLAGKYPHIKFIDPATSNRQLIDEGITALFTVRGTAGHEFARLGVPVVNAGPNPHMRYGFNHHPRSLAEYDDLIAGADRLTVGGAPSDIEEFYYMHYFSRHERFGADFSPVPAGASTIRVSPETLREWKAGHGAEIADRAQTYLDRVLKDQFPQAA
jgi:hypothetical protein